MPLTWRVKLSWRFIACACLFDRETEKAGMKGRDSVPSAAMAEEVMVQLTELLKEVEREQEL